MSRQYLNERWCSRCNKKTPTPYLKDNYRLLSVDDATGEDRTGLTVIDIGCGNGRNSRFMDAKRHTVYACDMVGNYGCQLTLGSDVLPLADSSIDIILANYVFMFLSNKELSQVVSELKRVSRPGCRIIVELYPAKDSKTPDAESSRKLRDRLLRLLGWTVIRKSKDRFIARNEK